MADTPTAIRAHQVDQMLELAWDGEPPFRVPYKHLRAQCPCATCRDEWTGERLLDPATIAANLSLAGMERVGNYAVRLSWSDGHSSGLYTWDVLHALARSASDASGNDPSPAE